MSHSVLELLADAIPGYAPRPGFGSQGRPIDVYANLYVADFVKSKGQAPSVYHYDVDINPVVKSGEPEETQALDVALDATAYDQIKNAFSPFLIPLDGDKAEFIVALKESGRDTDDDKRRFKVTIRPSVDAKGQPKVIDLETINDFCSGNKQTEAVKEMMLTAVQSVNILLRQDPAEKYKPVGAQGRRFFGLEGAVPISSGGVVLSGFMQSFRFTQSGKPAVQLDTAYSAFVVRGNLVDVAGQMLGQGGGGGGGGFRGGRGGRGGGGGRGGPPGQGGGGALSSLNRMQVAKLNKILLNAKFGVTHRPTDRVFTMRGVTTQTAEELNFLLNGKDGKADKMVSVVQYFKEVYNVTVRNPRLPCVSYGNKNYVPLEFVNVHDFNSIPMRALSSEQTAEIIRVAAKKPQDRAEMIRKWRKKLDYENLPQLRAWSLSISPNMMKLQARVLAAPMISYGGGKTLRAANGAWNLKAVKFLKPGKPLKSWAVVSFDRQVDVPQLQDFVGSLVQNLSANGCTVVNKRPKCVRVDPDLNGVPYAGIKPAMAQAARDAYLVDKIAPQLLVVIEPRKDQQLYSEVKRVGAEGLNKPVVTQVLLGTNFRKTGGQLDQYINNITLKINAKLAGVNSTVLVPQALDAQMMMLGADVTHPPARGGPLPPSIAVTVSAIDGTNAQFLPALRLQEGRVEIFQDLENMTYKHIQDFERNTKSKPAKILMFRDGVSEGQYSIAADQELAAIKAAAKRFGGNYKPKVTFVICAKRHNMRFFAAKEGDGDRTGNLPAGTVVDTDATHPFAFDFYLQAHAGLQGTAKPTHYVVISDEIRYTADKMQNLVNSLCYSYARATRSVSLIPVAYYADLIATKARDFVYMDDISDVQSSVSGSGMGSKVDFDPLRLKKRFEDYPGFNSVAWYM